MNIEKSNLHPSQKVIFLGYIVDAVETKMFLQEEKKDLLKIEISNLLLRQAVSIKEQMRPLGLMTVSIPAMSWAQAHMKTMPNFSPSVWNAHQSTLSDRVILPDQVKVFTLVATGRQLIKRKILDTGRSSLDKDRCECVGLGSPHGASGNPGKMGENGS